MKSAASFVLRPPTMEDAARILEWRNDPVTRHHAFDQHEISLETHLAWLEKTLSRPDTLILVLEVDGEPVGQIRYLQSQINFTIAPNMRSRGYGSSLLQLSAPIACRHFGIDRVFGVVKPDNIASCRAFEKAGFHRVADVVHNGQTCIKYEYRG